jgi:rhamnulokinase
MNASDVYLAIDLGASSGRVLAGMLDHGRVVLEEVHRFPNGPVAVGNRLAWNLLGLWQQIEQGLTLAAQKFGDRIVSVGADTWGVDYVLLDRNQDLVGPAFCYRDTRTVGILEKAWQRMPREAMFRETGLQFMEFNSAFQLHAMRLENSPLLDVADRFLMIPDFLHWMLCGVAANEATNASTTQLIRPGDGSWSQAMMEALEIPPHLFEKTIQPGTVLGEIRSDLANRTGLPKQVQVTVPATHDTGSAVLAVPASQFAPQQPDWCYISSGTWSLMGAELPRPLLTDACMARNFTNEGGALGSVRLLKNISGLWPIQQCRAIWQRQGKDLPWKTMVQLAESALPLQSLFNPDDARFVAPANMVEEIQSYYRSTGQEVLEDPGAIARSCLESLALRYRVCLGWLEELLGNRLDVIHIVGGGVQNHLLCQMTADACNRTVVAGPIEATAIGNVMMQAVGRGQLASIPEARRLLRQSAEVVEYHPRQAAAWNEAAARSF